MITNRGEKQDKANRNRITFLSSEPIFMMWSRKRHNQLVGTAGNDNMA